MRNTQTALRALSTHCKSSCIAFAVFYSTAFLFGAPLFSTHTVGFAIDQLFLTYLPFYFACRLDLAQFWQCVDNQPRTLDQLYLSRTVLGSVLGAWLDAVVIPLDWDRWWQSWPFCSHIGSLFGILLAALSSYFRIWTNPPFARQSKSLPLRPTKASRWFNFVISRICCSVTGSNIVDLEMETEELTPPIGGGGGGHPADDDEGGGGGHGSNRTSSLASSSFLEEEEEGRSTDGEEPQQQHQEQQQPQHNQHEHGLLEQVGQRRQQQKQQQKHRHHHHHHNGRCSRHFFSQEPPKLCGIIYAEFDNEIGRVIRYQVPDEIFDKQRFDTISSAIIPSEEMRDRMIKINMYDYKITGYPVGIKNKKYQREVFIFNLCFVVAASDADDTDDSIYYEPLVQKCAEYLVELEQERGFLSEEKHRLPALMRQIFDGLNQKGECVCPITDQTTIYLRLCPAFLCREPHPLSPFLVPIFTRLPPPISRAALNRMDVLSQKICPQIDGIRCIKDIACAVQIDTDLVGRCVRNLCFYGCVALLPQFLYSNCYVPGEHLRHFFDSPQIVEKCLNFVRLWPDDDPSPALFSDIARLYLGLKSGSPLSEWLLRMCPRRLRVDERKLVQFGLFYGILRKQHIYPVAIRRDDGTKIAALCDGEHSLDDLALHYTCSPVELQRLLTENGNFRFITR